MQLDAVYSNSEELSRWYKKIRIESFRYVEVLFKIIMTVFSVIYINMYIIWHVLCLFLSFSEGSIVVDYVVELTDIAQEVDTREIKQLFHEALQTQLPPVNNSNLSLADDSDGWGDNGDVIAAAAVDRKAAMWKLGNFILDPTYTDFYGLFQNIHISTFYHIQTRSQAKA